ncbi:MAG TPA: high-affinity branched-chain amino acid ABC transporter ATP-binding protein LivG [Syntrophobacteraceae bacterium]|nr:high-affinity branched-chain amino acid ABC transporter ATP-binding protein LivG [Syntrophobacteraceae bacterium]
MALLEVRHLGIQFGGLRAVHDLNLTLEGGELLGLIGPNGAGKTTVFNMVCGFYQPTAGEIVFDGQPLAGLATHRVTALGIARTFQNIRLWNNLTVFQNLCIAQHHRLGYGFLDAIWHSRTYRTHEKQVHQASHELLDMLALQHCADEYPKNLPYGLQRRLEIGRALAVRPKVLLLDEPAAGMNPNEAEQLIDLIRWIRKQFQVTIWLIEHQMRVVMGLCEWIKVLDFGETIAEGTPDQVRQNPRVVQAYLGDEGVAHA